MNQETEQAPPDITPESSTSTAPRKSWGRRVARSLILFVLVPYLAIVAIFTLFQRSIIYPGTRRAEIRVADSLLPEGKVHDITADTADGLKLHGWHAVSDRQSAANREECDKCLAEARWLVLSFPGNGGCRVDRGTELQDFAELRMNVFLFDYRGYGDNSGSCSETSLVADAHSIWNYATKERKVPHDRVIIFGESLGGGVATRLAADMCEAKTPPAALVLSSSFSSLPDVAAWHYPYFPVRALLLDRYSSATHVRNVTCPVVMMHGTDDEIVPLEFGRKLFDAAPDRSAGGIEKTFVEIPHAMHNGIPRDTLKTSLRKLTRAIDSQKRSQ